LASRSISTNQQRTPKKKDHVKKGMRGHEWHTRYKLDKNRKKKNKVDPRGEELKAVKFKIGKKKKGNGNAADVV